MDQPNSSLLTGLVLACCSCLAPHADAFIPNNGDLETWPSSALTPTRERSGLPITLTWGFVPDGTPIQFSVGGTAVPSDLIATMNAAFDGNPSETDLTKQPWFFLFEDSYAKWDQVSGITFLYEPNNTSETSGGGTVAGLAGVRPDMRIGGFDLVATGQGDSTTLAWNWFPSSGGDMGINTARVDDFYTNASNDYRRAKNTIQHEIGHGINLEHWEADVLMNAILRLNLDGIQLDEVRAAHFYFGDKYEETNGGQGNATPALATSLGTLTPTNSSISVGTDADIPTQQIAPDAEDFVSISNMDDVDYFSFEIDRPGKVTIDLTPLGGIIDVLDGGSNFDANSRANLILRLVDSDGQTELALVNDTEAGSSEQIVDFTFDEAGEYFVGVGVTNSTIQMYRLDLALTSIPGDLDGDGDVDDDDLAIAINNFTGSTGLGMLPGDGDSDDDGDVDNKDLGFIIGEYTGAITGQSLSLLASVPEPSSLVFLGIGGLMVFRRR